MSPAPASWTVSPDPITIEVLGETLQIRELTADEYIDLMATATTRDRFDSKKYCAALIQQMVVSPEIDPATLKPGVRAALVRRLENLLGISPEALKNSMLE